MKLGKDYFADQKESFLGMEKDFSIIELCTLCCTLYVCARTYRVYTSW